VVQCTPAKTAKTGTTKPVMLRAKAVPVFKRMEKVMSLLGLEEIHELCQNRSATSRKLARELRTLARRLGVEDVERIKLYSARHTGITRMKDLPRGVIARQAGLVPNSTVIGKHYAFPAPGADAKALGGIRTGDKRVLNPPSQVGDVAVVEKSMNRTEQIGRDKTEQHSTISAAQKRTSTGRETAVIASATKERTAREKNELVDLFKPKSHR